MSHLHDFVLSGRSTVQLTFPEGSILNPPINGEYFDTVYKKNVTLINARLSEKAPTLQDQGFALFKHNLNLSEVYDNNQAEIDDSCLVDIIKAHTNASDVLMLGVNSRYEGDKKSPGSIKFKPDIIVHTDWGPNRIRQISQNPIKDRILSNNQWLAADISHFINSSARWGIVNLWLPVTTITHNNLALCDKSAVKQEDIVRSVTYLENDKGSELMSLVDNPSHRWYHFPLMESNEGLIFTQFDSLEGDDFIPTFHSAFNVPTPSPTSRSNRRSLEYRFFVKWT